MGAPRFMFFSTLAPATGGARPAGRLRAGRCPSAQAARAAGRRPGTTARAGAGFHAAEFEPPSASHLPSSADHARGAGGWNGGGGTRAACAVVAWPTTAPRWRQRASRPPPHPMPAVRSRSPRCSAPPRPRRSPPAWSTTTPTSANTSPTASATPACRCASATSPSATCSKSPTRPAARCTTPRWRCENVPAAPSR